MHLIEITVQEANVILDAGHYLKRATYPPYHVLAHKQGETILALAVYAAPTAASFKRTGGGRPKAGAPAERVCGIMELTRLWVSPEAEFHTTRFLAATLSWIKVNGRIPVEHEKDGKVVDVTYDRCRCVVSYADPRPGVLHSGKIYQHSGWVYLGESTVTHAFEVTPEGQEVVDRNGKTHIFSVGQRVTLPKCYRLWETKSLGKILQKTKWRSLDAKPKHVYLFPFSRRQKQIEALIAEFPRYRKAIAQRQTGPSVKDAGEENPSASENPLAIKSVQC